MGIFLRQLEKGNVSNWRFLLFQEEKYVFNCIQKLLRNTTKHLFIQNLFSEFGIQVKYVITESKAKFSIVSYKMCCESHW